MAVFCSGHSTAEKRACRTWQMKWAKKFLLIQERDEADEIFYRDIERPESNLDVNTEGLQRQKLHKRY